MKEPIQLTHFCDPGHSWLEVPRKLLDEFGLLHKITPYSYQNKDMVYLEEDVDMGTFLGRAKDLGHNVSITMLNLPHHSIIRRYCIYYNE